MREPIRITFPVRGNEIGATGAVTLSGIARYCEWGRWALFREEGAQVIREGFKGGVARAQTIELHDAFRYPDDAVLDIWIARVGGSSLDFGHELRTGRGTLVARARVTVVQLGENGKEPFPAWMADHVCEREAVSPLLLGATLSGDVYEHSWTVRPSDLDQFRHVNQARYVDHADDVRQLAALASHDAGFTGDVRKITVSYEREMRAPDQVTARIARRDDGLRDVQIITADGRIANRAVLEQA